MPTGPHVRARSSAELLRYLASVEPELLHLIREHWPDSGYDMLVSAAPTAWIPVSVSRAISDTILKHRGAKRLVALYRHYIAEELIRGRFFRSLVDVAPKKRIGDIGAAIYEHAHKRHHYD